ncbi:DUF4230 domain-containing protein [Chloroflexia bacterium SDU3-3]|nr:DUF4230 domain-containing protein [Chloroflexia bacterium SDU3-3]
MPRYEDDERDERDERSRREGLAPRQRDSLIERRLRARRGEDYDDEDDDFAPMPRYRSAPAGYPAPTSRMGNILYILLGVAALIALVAIVAPRMVGSLVPTVSLPSVPNVPAAIQQVVATPTATVIDRGGTILQIRSLNRLETNQFSAERVIEAKIERGNPLDMVLGDKLLLIASGTVISGVDMGKLADQDVTISPDGKTITISLPPSEIFIQTLDNERTRVYDRTTGIFANQDKDLESKARLEADAQILQAACEANVLQKAADEAKTALTMTMRLAGFQEVVVNASAGQCVAPAVVPTAQAAQP